MASNIKILTTKNGYKIFNNCINDYLVYQCVVNNYSEVSTINKFELNNSELKKEYGKLVFIEVEKLEDNMYLDRAIQYAITNLKKKGIAYKIEKIDMDKRIYINAINKTKDCDLSRVILGWGLDTSSFFMTNYYNAKELEKSDEIEVEV